MACCMLGLLMVYHCLDALAHWRTRLREFRAGSKRWLLRTCAPVGLVRRLVCIAGCAFGLGLVSTTALAHAQHLARETEAARVLAVDLCRGWLVAAAPVFTVLKP